MSRVEWMSGVAAVAGGAGGPDWPRQVTVNGRPWALDRSDPERLSATPPKASPRRLRADFSAASCPKLCP